MIAALNGHHRLNDVVAGAEASAARAVVAACAFRRSLIDEHRIDFGLFNDPVMRLLFTVIRVYYAQHPNATQAPASALIKFMASTPEFSSKLRSEDAEDVEGTLSPSEIIEAIDAGWHTADLIAGNVETLRDATFQRSRSERLAALERLPRDRFLTEARNYLQELDESTDSEVAEITALTAAELDGGDFPLSYLVEDVLVEGQPCIVAAPKKSLKTNIMIALLLSLVSGCRFLGEFYILKKCRAALISGESGKPTIQETARRIARASGWPNLSDYDGAFFGFDLPNLASDNSLRALRAFIRKFKIQVLIVDPAYLCLPLGDDAGNLFKVGAILMPLLQLAQEDLQRVRGGFIAAGHQRGTSRRGQT